MVLGNKSDDRKYKFMHVFWKLDNDQEKCQCFQCAIDNAMKFFKASTNSFGRPKK